MGRVRSLDRVVPYVAKGKSDSVKTLKGRTLKPQKNSVNGYFYVQLGRGNMFTVHSLVALAFIGERPPGALVLHADGNGENNAVENLSYGTPMENKEDSIEHGTFCAGEAHPQSKLTTAQVIDMRRRHKNGESMAKLSLAFGVSYLTARNVLNRKTWRWVRED